MAFLCALVALLAYDAISPLPTEENVPKVLKKVLVVGVWIGSVSSVRISMLKHPEFVQLIAQLGVKRTCVGKL